jgi:hypothetical protein
MRLKRITRIDAHDIGASHFSTSERNDFSALILISLNVVFVGSVELRCTDRRSSVNHDEIRHFAGWTVSEIRKKRCCYLVWPANLLFTTLAVY